MGTLLGTVGMVVVLGMSFVASVLSTFACTAVPERVNETSWLYRAYRLVEGCLVARVVCCSDYLFSAAGNGAFVSPRN
ncbi:hypothetical protein F5Y01DRAFT_279033 [Xylaria sp. FL0043]|nr:hypothetical protein F5Y01DRAFT_279033 [Xylaria sp. FL0043]